MAIKTNTKIGLISKALILLGEEPANSLSDDRYGVTVGSNLFELIYENELQSNPWRFCAAKKACSRINTTPLNEYRYVHQIPTDCLLLRHVYPNTDYEVYGDRIYSNNLTVEIDYTFKPEVTAVPAYFATLLTYALARDMIKPITEGANGVEIMQKKYVMQRDRAMYADAQARPPRRIQDSPFTDVRG